MSFIRTGKMHTMRSGDFLVWQTTRTLSDFNYSKDFDADLLFVSNPFLSKLIRLSIWIWTR